MIDPIRPPRSLDAERSLLGAMMLSQDAADKISGWINQADFYTEQHQQIFFAIRECYPSADAVTVAEWFTRKGKGDQVENGAYLTGLVNDTPGISNITGYARIVREKSDARKLVDLGMRISNQAITGRPPAELIDELQGYVLDWTKTGLKSARTVQQAAVDWFDRMSERSENKEQIDTGLVDVDRIWQGMQSDEFIILAGRPGMGKTAALLTILNNVCRDHYGLFFSLEMSAESLVKRMVGGGRIPGWKLRNPSKLESSDWPELAAGTQALKSKKLIIDDTAGLSIQNIASRARLAKRQHDIKLICVDYLQLVTAKSENRLQEVSLVSRQLKKLAKDLQVPVIATAQLNRGVEGRAEKRPTLADLRESGQLEQDADIITFLYRGGYYDENDKTGVTEWITAKHRDSEPGNAYTVFNPRKQLFVNADHGLVNQYQNRETAVTGQSKFMQQRAKDWWEGAAR